MKYFTYCIACYLFLILFHGCGGSNSNGNTQESVTWKNKFPSLWSAAYANEMEVKPEHVTYLEFVQAVKNALKNDQDFIDVVNISEKITSWSHIITADEVTNQGSFSTVTINDNRILKKCGVDVYIVGNSQSIPFSSINNSYFIFVVDGAISLTTAWDNCSVCVSPPIGEELIIFLSYNDETSL